MQSQCSCPKWYDALDLDAVFALIDKYEAHPVCSMGLSNYHPCFICQNDDRIPENTYAVDEFRAKELFEDLPPLLVRLETTYDKKQARGHYTPRHPLKSDPISPTYRLTSCELQ